MTEFETPLRELITRRNTLKGSLGLAALAVGASAYFSPLPGSGISDALAGPSEGELLADGPLPENVMGETTAPNTIIEYSSMTCPHCARFHKDIVPDIKSKYVKTGKARYIIREFPLDKLAFAASMLARCAGPEKYFPFVKVMFEKQQIWAFGEGDPVERLFTMAKQAGFTREAFETCLKDQKLLDGITAVRKRGNEKFGVNSTPTLFVNGQVLKGARAIDDVEKLMKLDKKS